MSTLIKGIGGYLPERVVTSEELEEMAGYKDHGVKLGLCKMLTGCASRHWAAKEELCSDIAARAGEIAMKEAGVEPQDVDAILFWMVWDAENACLEVENYPNAARPPEARAC